MTSRPFTLAGKKMLEALYTLKSIHPEEEAPSLKTTLGASEGVAARTAPAASKTAIIKTLNIETPLTWTPDLPSHGQSLAGADWFPQSSKTANHGLKC